MKRFIHFFFTWKIGLVVFVVLVFWLLWNWQPERQLRLHQRGLLDAAQERDWPKLNQFLDDDFRTPCGHNKTTAIQQLGEVLRPFFVLKIADSETELSWDGQTGRVRSVLRIEGKGNPLGEFVKGAVNESKEPFVFTWKHASWKPWDWRLVRAEHSLIALAGNQMPF